MGEILFFVILPIQRYLKFMIYRIIISLIALFGGFGHLSANAASSDWFETKGAKMRLITAVRPDSQKVDAALEVLLEKGWKTYWRSPGESGIPPFFDFAQSSNIIDAKVKFPTPSYFNELGVEIVGYKNRVIFPIELQVGTFGKPIILQLRTVIGICGEVCIPVQVKMSVIEPGTIGPTFDVSRALNDASASVPSGPAKDLQVVSVGWNKNQPTKININAVVNESGKEVQLHVEGPQDWFLLPAKLVERKGNSASFLLDISDIPENANPATTIFRFTLVADGRGIEQELSPTQ
jgi:DsbC/DsbD-like thiol-disulfide interchange protein